MKCLPHLPTRSVGFFLLVMVASLFSLGCSDSNGNDNVTNPMSVFTSTSGSGTGLPTSGQVSGVGAIESPIVSVPTTNDGRRDHTNAPLLDNWHPGWQQSECLSCHTDQSRIPDHSYPDTSLCYLCHGTNGLPGFGDGTPPVIKGVVSAPTANGVTITWTTDEPAITRLILRTTAGDKMEFPVSNDYAQSHRFAVTGLLSSTRYTYEIIAIDKNQNKATSASFGTLCFITQSSAATAGGASATAGITIDGPSFPEIDNFSVLARWITSVPTTCEVEVIDTVELSAKKLNAGGPMTDFSFPIGDLKAGRKYYVTITATDEAGNSVTGTRHEVTTEPL